jgi:hypothetical protein
MTKCDIGTRHGQKLPDISSTKDDQRPQIGETTISSLQWKHRALVPTISQVWSPDTMSRWHFGQV